MLLTASTTSFILMDASGILNASANHTPELREKCERLRRLLQLVKAMHIPCGLTWLTNETEAPSESAINSLFDHLFTRDTFNACEAGLTDWLLQVGTPTVQGNQRSLPKHLQKPKVLTRTQVVMAGGHIHAGLLQTALSLLEEDFDVWLISDLCYCDQQADLEATFDRLASNGVELVTTNMVAAEWAGRPDQAAYTKWLSPL